MKHPTVWHLSPNNPLTFNQAMALLDVCENQKIAVGAIYVDVDPGTVKDEMVKEKVRNLNEQLQSS